MVNPKIHARTQEEHMYSEGKIKSPATRTKASNTSEVKYGEKIRGGRTVTFAPDCTWH